MEPAVKLPRNQYGDFPARMFADHPGSRFHSAEDFRADFMACEEQDAGRLAFTILAYVYQQFGYGADFIPFQEDGRISEEQLRAL